MLPILNYLQFIFFFCQFWEKEFTSAHIFNLLLVLWWFMRWNQAGYVLDVVLAVNIGPVLIVDLEL